MESTSDELDDARWHALSQKLREEHRQDLHQVLAYASLFDGAEVTAVLVYPMFERTWARWAEHGRTVRRASVCGGGRRLRLALAGIPIRLRESVSVSDIARTLDRLRLNHDMEDAA